MTAQGSKPKEVFDLRRAEWKDWAEKNIGGDSATVEAATDAILDALLKGYSIEDAMKAGRAAARPSHPAATPSLSIPSPGGRSGRKWIIAAILAVVLAGAFVLFLMPGGPTALPQSSHWSFRRFTKFWQSDQAGTVRNSTEPQPAANNYPR